jgi:ATP-dependent DNA helicase RecG
VGTDVSNRAKSLVRDFKKIVPKLDLDIQVQGNIIAVSVPEGMEKPYSCPAGFFMRMGPNSQKLDRNDIMEFFRTEGHTRYDEILCKDLPVEDSIDMDAYESYMKKAKISDVISYKDILRNLGCSEYFDGKEVFTNAGALFFRNNSNDVKFRHAGVVCALYKGTDKVTILDAKEYSRNLIDSIDESVSFLRRNLQLRYKIETSRREEVLEIPERALLEAVTNAVCHRDLFEKGARVTVEIFDDRVEVTSPGGAPKGINDSNFGRQSVTRNPVIASMLHRSQYIEQMGTGIQRMRLALKEAELPEPIFQREGFFKVIFTRVANESVKSASKRSIPVYIPETVDRVKELVDFCSVPRTRDEMQQYLGILSRSYFSSKILKPLINSGKLIKALPDKNSSRNQKYIKA